MFRVDKQEFGTFIARLRKEKGITQKELAEQQIQRRYSPYYRGCTA